MGEGEHRGAGQRGGHAEGEKKKQRGNEVPGSRGERRPAMNGHDTNTH